MIHSAWLPHSRFRGDECAFDPPLIVPAAGEARFESRLAWDGQLVENAFLILRAGTIRVFARLRVPAGAAPQAIVEAITTSAAG